MKRGLDKLTRARRSWNMSRIRGKNTTPEMIVRRTLHRLGYRFRLHVRLPLGGTSYTSPIPHPRPNSSTGKKSGIQKLGTRITRPSEKRRSVSVDILLPKHKIAIFVHGCFWHRHRGCKNCTTPTHRREFWLEKLNGNATRDKRNQQALKKLGWRVLVIWECETDREEIFQHVAKRLQKTDSFRREMHPDF